MDTNEIKNLAELMKDNDVTNLEIEDGKIKIKLERAVHSGNVTYNAVPVATFSESTTLENHPKEDPCDYITAQWSAYFTAPLLPANRLLSKKVALLKKQIPYVSLKQ